MARSDWVERFLKLCKEQGARIEETKKGVMIYPPDRSKSPVLVHRTNSDPRAKENTRQTLRRSGFDIPKK